MFPGVVGGGEPVMSDAAAAPGPVSSGLFGFMVNAASANTAFIWVWERNCGGDQLQPSCWGFVPRCWKLPVSPAVVWMCPSLAATPVIVLGQMHLQKTNVAPVGLFLLLCPTHAPAVLGIQPCCLQGTFPLLSVLPVVVCHPPSSSSNAVSFRQAPGTRRPLHSTTSKHQSRTKSASRCWEPPCA